ncbi:cysteine-rich receptor-like protein kinase 25 [Carya illinoinensis]|uniref:cysteine-rich receptor-like protein kinase 25 n=1 Tax=Carya illinoinensis TaxID=32201 RepID=UPI001C71D184|nr:cysteine-rich receptor-like protein kinase 25 [Carya illinoinensis]
MATNKTIWLTVSRRPLFSKANVLHMSYVFSSQVQAAPSPKIASTIPVSTPSSLPSSNASRNIEFYNTTSGQNTSDPVYGLFLCRGDITFQMCRTCVAAATEELAAKCSREKVAIILYDECMIRYSNESFFSTVAVRCRIHPLNTQNITEQDRFNRLCMPNLSSADCNWCLQSAINRLPICCGGKQGRRALFPSCNIRKNKNLNNHDSRHCCSNCCLLIRRRRKKFDAGQGDNALNDITTVESLQFDFSTIEAATNKFSDNSKLGEGGFGVVYKAALSPTQVFGLGPVNTKRVLRDGGHGSGRGVSDAKVNIVF